MMIDTGGATNTFDFSNTTGQQIAAGLGAGITVLIISDRLSVHRALNRLMLLNCCHRVRVFYNGGFVMMMM